MKSALGALLLAALLVPAAYGKDDYHGLPPAGAAAQGAGKITVCAACHGVNGIGVTPAHPNLAGQNYNYLLKELEDFRSGARTSSIMSGMAMTIPPSPANTNLKDIAAYFAELRPMWAYAPAPSAPPAAPDEIALGKVIYERGVAGKGIPACAACHGLSGEGNEPMAIPALAGQHAPYLVTQLVRFATGKRSNSPGHVMHTIARAMNAAEDAAVAAYLQQLNPDTTLGIGPKDFTEYARGLQSKSAAQGAPAAAATNVH